MPALWLRSARRVIPPASWGRDQRVRHASMDVSRSSRPVSAKRTAPHAVTGLEIDSTRNRASAVIGRPATGSAVPKAPVQTGLPPLINTMTAPATPSADMRSSTISASRSGSVPSSPRSGETGAARTLSATRPEATATRMHSPDERDRQIGKRGLERGDEIARVICDADVGVDLKGHGQAVIGVVAQARDIGGDPAAMAIDRPARRVGIDRHTRAVEDAGGVLIDGYAVEQPVEIGGLHRIAAEQQMPPAHQIGRGRGEAAA